jgi:hypothetical protein
MRIGITLTDTEFLTVPNIYLYQATDIKRGEEFSIEELESKVTEILFSYTKEQIKSLVFYPYLQKAFNVH